MLDQLFVTFLAGGRPALLERTLESLNVATPALFEKAFCIAVLNSLDIQSAELLSRFHIQHYNLTPPEGKQYVSLGACTSVLASNALDLDRSRYRYWMHIEDDWLVRKDAMPLSDHVEQAAAILDAEPSVKQVRLRHKYENVLRTHIVTAKPLVWDRRDADGHLECKDAHLTFNPFLARTFELTKLFDPPVRGELEFQRRAVHAGFRKVVQLMPGVFVHIGDGENSLRAKTRCPQ